MPLLLLLALLLLLLLLLQLFSYTTVITDKQDSLPTVLTRKHFGDADARFIQNRCPSPSVADPEFYNGGRTVEAPKC